MFTGGMCTVSFQGEHEQTFTSNLRGTYVELTVWLAAGAVCKIACDVAEIIILSYAFKMRQDYLSTSYLDQKYLPSERSKTSEIWIDPSNVCWDNLVSFWRHMMIFFSHLSLFYRWNILKICENLSKWNMDVVPSHLRILRSHHVDYAHHVSYVCTPCASHIGDIAVRLSNFTYVR